MEHSVAIALAQKEYACKMIKLLQEEYNLLGRYLKIDCYQKMENVYDKISEGKKELLKPIVLPDCEFIKQWYKVYEPMGFAEHGPEYYSDQNERMRSKSEVIIANKLKQNNIPYQYEAPLMFDSGKIVRPDFRVLNVRTRQTFYWEHLGMMGDEAYATDNLNKITDYEKSGYFPGINLILTHETSDRPLGTKDIERVIHAYLQ